MAPTVGTGELTVVGKRYQDRETSPERTKVWVEPKPKEMRKVPVVYYLTRNGQLEHPHFIEVPLSSSHGLYLKDVISRLNVLRGHGMANMYSWSSKRSYKNGFVWHDLTDDDFIYPAQGQEYVLKGSELLPPSPPENAVKPADAHRRTSSWTHQLHLADQYKVYTAPHGGLVAADASTQTDDKARRRRRPASEDEPIAAAEATVISTEEISPPPSTSSPETLEALIKSARVHLSSSDSSADICDRTARDHPSGRMKASTVLKQLITCGSISVKDSGLSLGHRVSGSDCVMDGPDFCRVRVENQEYFSGSLVDTAKKGEELLWLKRSSSFNADRSSSRLDSGGKGGKGKCKPATNSDTKPKLRSGKNTNSNSAICRSAPGSKRMNEEITTK